MRIFISYSNPNLSLIRTFAEQIGIWGSTFFWNQSYFPEGPSLEELNNWIDNSDLVILLIMGNTVIRASTVTDEINRAKSMGRIILPIVSNKVHSSELGFLEGIKYHQIDVSNPESAMHGISEIIEGFPKDRIGNNEWLGILLSGISFLIYLAGYGK